MTTVTLLAGVSFVFFSFAVYMAFGFHKTGIQPTDWAGRLHFNGRKFEAGQDNILSRYPQVGAQRVEESQR
jgi:hypothetical protein